jgi:hypothetical protein
MATYLWCRGQTWFFQLKPPRDLQPVLGSTPFRVRLPVQHHREASRCARYLAGLAEQWLSAMRYRGVARLRLSSTQEGDESWTDKDFAEARTAARRRFVDALLAEVQNLNRVAEQWEAFNRSKPADQTDEADVANAQQRVFEQVTAGWNAFAKNLIEDYDQVFSDMQVRSSTAGDIIQKLEDLTESYAADSHDWKTEITAITAKAKKSRSES